MSAIGQSNPLAAVTSASELTAAPAAPAAPGPAREPRVAWRLWRFIGAAVAVAVCIFVTAAPWSKMLLISITDEESSHVLLAPVAALWLILSRRQSLKGVQPTGTWIGPLMVAAGWFMLIHGYDIRDNEYWFFGAILMTVGSALSFLGAQVLFKLWPAFLVLLFLIPVPGFFRIYISMPLQTIMANLTHAIGELVGFSIDRTGNVLIINDQPIEIAEACNGMRMVFALFLVGYTVAFSMPLRTSVRIGMLISAPLLALLCNLLRMLPTVWLYGHASKGTAEAFHDMAGWAMVIVAYFLLMGGLSALEWAEVPIYDRRRKQGGGA